MERRTWAEGTGERNWRAKEVAGGEGGQERRGGAKKKRSQDVSGAANKEEDGGGSERGPGKKRDTGMPGVCRI